MGSIIGDNIKISLFGESHGPYIGLTIDGLPAGIKIDYDFMKFQMKKRKSFANLKTPRNENDSVEIISGVFNGYTCGTPLTVLIKNENTISSSYEKTKDIIRPGHSDYVAHLKYHGFENYNGGGHFSGRLTAPLVAIGSICLKILEAKGIKISSHIYMLHNIYDDKPNEDNLIKYMDKFNNSLFPTVNDEKAELMKKEIEKAKANNDSVGGIIESFILTNNNTIGEPFFNSLESKISSYLFSIGGVKGIEFGLGFDFAKYYGSEIKDEWEMKNNFIHSIHNYNGGINGGIANNQPIIIKTCLKPTPSIAQKQLSVNIKTLKNEELLINGRHDPAIIHRARVVIDSLLALAIIDLCAFRYGNEWLRND